MNEVSVADEAQHETQRSQLRRPFFPTVKRWLREPLLHFLLLGVMLFAANHYMERTAAGRRRRRSRSSCRSTTLPNWP